jgi:hypothetical protein
MGGEWGDAQGTALARRQRAWARAGGRAPQAWRAGAAGVRAGACCGRVRASACMPGRVAAHRALVRRGCAPRAGVLLHGWGRVPQGRERGRTPTT